MSRLKRASGVKGYGQNIMLLAMTVVGLAAAVVVVGKAGTPVLPHTKAACVENSYLCQNNYVSGTLCLSKSYIYRCYGGAWLLENTPAKGCHYEGSVAVANKQCAEGERNCNGSSTALWECKQGYLQPIQDCGNTNWCVPTTGCNARCPNNNPTPKPQPTTPPANYTCGSKAYAYCSSGTCPKGQTCKKNDTKKSCNCKSI